MDLLILFLAVEIIGGILTFNFYKAAGRKAWEAFVPVYRIVIMLKIIQRPWWWVVLCYMPVVGNVMAVVIIFELLHVFNYRKLKYTLYTIITIGIYMGYLNFTKKLKYVGRNIQDMRRHVSELAASLIFAVVAATAIRAFTFEAFTIPTPSMEKSLMVGDFLFVSKMHYGSRPPLTPLALPLVHNKVPFGGMDSYVDWIQLPYWRFPKFQDVERGEAVVFNYPAEDIRPINMEGKVRPIDKREHYVKRCVAVPGDTLSIIDRHVHIDGEDWEFPERANPQWDYYVKTNGTNFNARLLKERFDINYLSRNEMMEYNSQSDVLPLPNSSREFVVTIPQESLEEFKALSNVEEIVPLNHVRGQADFPDIFPNPKNQRNVIYNWTRDNYGPLWMPAEGATIELNKDNFHKYYRVITAYEGNTLEERDGGYILNGEPAETYTFKQGYYWMMGDNRHHSDDSRYWGFVPEDHIVGKPVFIWMSYDKFADNLGDKIRWERIFTTVHGEGPRQSYFWHFIVVVTFIYLGSYYYKRRKKKKASA